MARVAVQPLDIETGLVDDHAAAAKVLPGAPHQSSARSKAIEAFAVEGLPNRRLEEYRYFDLRQMLAKAGPLAVTPAASSVDTTDSATCLFDELARNDQTHNFIRASLLSWTGTSLYSSTVDLMLRARPSMVCLMVLSS